MVECVSFAVITPACDCEPRWAERHSVISRNTNAALCSPLLFGHEQRLPIGLLLTSSASSVLGVTPLTLPISGGGEEGWKTEDKPGWI